MVPSINKHAVSNKKPLVGLASGDKKLESGESRNNTADSESKFTDFN